MASSISSSAQFLRPNVAVYRPSQNPRSVSIRMSATCTTASVAEKAATSSLYDVLGIQKGATREEIKSAFRRMARVLHPDVVASGERDETGREFMRVHEAYHTLSDPAKRADYDRLVLGRRRGRQMGVVRSETPSRPYPTAARSSENGFYGFSRRSNWETDQCW